MGAAVWLAAGWLAGALATPGLRYAALGALVAGGAAIYAGLAMGLGAVSVNDLKGAMRR